jgi:hypothetical protein
VRELAPIGHFNVNIELFRGAANTFPCGVALRICYPLNLIEASDCISNMGGVGQRLFFFLRKRKVFTGEFGHILPISKERA